MNGTDNHSQLHLPQQSGKEEAGVYRGRSEEGLIENTWWAVVGMPCYHSDVLSGVILKLIIYTDNSAAGGREW